MPPGGCATSLESGTVCPTALPDQDMPSKNRGAGRSSWTLTLDSSSQRRTPDPRVDRTAVRHVPPSSGTHTGHLPRTFRTRRQRTVKAVIPVIGSLPTRYRSVSVQRVLFCRTRSGSQADPVSPVTPPSGGLIHPRPAVPALFNAFLLRVHLHSTRSSQPFRNSAERTPARSLIYHFARCRGSPDDTPGCIYQDPS